MVDGDLRVLLADDSAGSVALARRNDEQAVVIALNVSESEQALAIPVSGLVPDGTVFTYAFAEPDRYVQLIDQPTAEEGLLTITLPPLGAVVLATEGADLAPPEPPAELRVEALGDGFVELAWQDSGDGDYIVYRSPLSGGGWVRVNDAPLTEPRYRDEGVENGRQYHYVVTALDAVGNESAYSPESEAIPRLSIDAAHLAGPLQVEHPISASTRPSVSVQR